MAGPEWLLISEGIVHPSVVARRRFARLIARIHADAVLADARRCGAQPRPAPPRPLRELGLAAGIEAIARSAPDLVALYLHHPADAPASVAVLADYVARGGRLLGVHSATASFKPNERFRELMGGAFAGHGRVRANALSDERGDTSPVRIVDEAYEHEFVRDVDVWYRWANGSPAAWTSSYGAGRVGYVATGHRAHVWRSDGVARVVGSVVARLLDGGSVQSRGSARQRAGNGVAGSGWWAGQGGER